MVSPNHLMRRYVAVHVVTNGTPDVYGNPSDQVTTRNVVGEIQQETRTEGAPDSQTQIGAWRLFLPAGTEIDGWSRVEIDGAVFELLGPPWRAVNPRTGQESHIEATLARTV